MIFVDNRSGQELPLDEYEALAAFVIKSENQSDDNELSVSLVTTEEMHVLNKQYRDIDAPTDVLAFENDDELLGDVVVCPAIAKEHAEDFESDFAAEIELMLTHGILHLLGYDHLDDADARRMESKENEILQRWRAH